MSTMEMAWRRPSAIPHRSLPSPFTITRPSSSRDQALSQTRLAPAQKSASSMCRCSRAAATTHFSKPLRAQSEAICELLANYFKIRASSFETNHSLSRIPSGAACSFAPSAVVLQCGADALTGDPLGEFNLTVKGYTDCLAELRRALPDTPGKQWPRLKKTSFDT